MEGNKTALGLILLKYVALNISGYLLSNYDKVLGAIFTTVSIIYVCFKMWNEFLKPKKNGLNK